MNDIVLVLSDIHHKTDQADKIIRQVGADKVICLGDAFDDFYDTPEIVRNTSEWFVDFINNPKHIFIAGNHEMSYSIPQSPYRCSGYEQWKDFIINDIVPRKDWGKMVYYHILDGKWLLSHAGLHKHHVPKHIADLHQDRPAFLKAIAGYLDEEIIKGFRGESWVFRAGRSRGGFQNVGGLTWCDFEREFYPVKGLNQIVGHTPQDIGVPKWCRLKEGKLWYPPATEWSPKLSDLNDVNQSTNVCLDVWGNTHWAIWNGEKLTFFNYRDDL